MTKDALEIFLGVLVSVFSSKDFSTHRHGLC